MTTDANVMMVSLIQLTVRIAITETARIEVIAGGAEGRCGVSMEENLRRKAKGEG
jgi:hypothetical protein